MPSLIKVVGFFSRHFVTSEYIGSQLSIYIMAFEYVGSTVRELSLSSICKDWSFLNPLLFNLGREMSSKALSLSSSNYSLTDFYNFYYFWMYFRYYFKLICWNSLKSKFKSIWLPSPKMIISIDYKSNKAIRSCFWRLTIFP